MTDRVDHTFENPLLWIGTVGLDDVALRIDVLANEEDAFEAARLIFLCRALGPGIKIRGWRSKN
jgi:hypothetical protein